MGVCGLRFDDFCLLTPFEFQAILDAYTETEKSRSRDMWECMRVLASVNVSPFSKGRITPQSLMKFPWDDDDVKKRKPVSKEEDKAHLERLMKRIKN